MSGEVSEAVIIVLAGTFLMLILVIFIISFFFIHQRRQTAHRLEKASLKAQYEAEILNAENEIQESTMKHISRELHDNVGQLLTLVKIQLNKVQEEQPENIKITNSREYVTNALADVRALSKSLYNENLLQAGLAKAMAFELERIQKTGALNTHFTEKYEGQILDHKQEILVFRMFQELAQNCLKHADANNIWVTLTETEQQLSLSFTDDGQGFEIPNTEVQNGFATGAGLRNLHHRAGLLGGSFLIAHNQPKGMAMTLTIPTKRF
jgi:signal transduction histidine kinase